MLFIYPYTHKSSTLEAELIFINLFTRPAAGEGGLSVSLDFYGWSMWLDLKCLSPLFCFEFQHYKKINSAPSPKVFPMGFKYSTLSNVFLLRFFVCFFEHGQILFFKIQKSTTFLGTQSLSGESSAQRHGVKETFTNRASWHKKERWENSQQHSCLYYRPQFG